MFSLSLLMSSLTIDVILSAILNGSHSYSYGEHYLRLFIYLAQGSYDKQPLENLLHQMVSASVCIVFQKVKIQNGLWRSETGGHARLTNLIGKLIL